MKTVIGIDIGGSTTKIIGIKDDSILEGMIIKSNDPVTSLFGALGKYIHYNNIDFSDIEKIMITGVGSGYIEKSLYGISTGKVDEFLANGLGGTYISKLTNLVVVSMGTGTSFVRVDNENINHIIGTGVGGGTIIGLAKLLLDVEDINDIVNLSRKGELKNIDLQIKDITNQDIPGLDMEVTASNFGKVLSNAKKEDIALGIINMVFQSIGITSVLAALNSNTKNLILIGNLVNIPECKEIFLGIGKMFNVNFIIPDFPEYITAIGAAIAYINSREYVEIKER